MVRAADGAYELLGVEHTASIDEIKSAYRTCAKEFHPDAGGSEEQMKYLNTVWDVLSDTRLRAAYDFTRAEHRAPAGAYA